MDNPITFRDKVLAFLYGHVHVSRDIHYGAPFEITQDGIAIILGISRSHASVVLGKMVSSGEVQCSAATIKDSERTNKRKIYLITPHGRAEFLER